VERGERGERLSALRTMSLRSRAVISSWSAQHVACKGLFQGQAGCVQMGEIEGSELVAGSVRDDNSDT